MRDVKLRFPTLLQDFLRSTIESAGGNEVYFLGRVFWSKEGTNAVATLEELDVLARGNRTSVPAIIERAEAWDIAIHNHPSGGLEPSEPDLAVAHELSMRSVGFAIISNDASEHYLVIPPFEERFETEPVDPGEVERFFSADGPLSAGLEGFEHREGQVQMALEVTKALNENRVIAAEAGTGIGKSFAYLVPAILWAVKNRKRVVVSTGTINLQEQLVGKDLPLLKKVLPFPFTFALIKGRNNYACRRKVKEIEADLEQEELVPSDERRQLKSIVEWVKTTPDGSRATLGWIPPAAVWEKAMSETDKSLKVNCPHYHECFYYQAKRVASGADVLVVNHHLFFSDLSVRQATANYRYDSVLPAYRQVIFDEAHHLEDVASEHLGVSFSRAGIHLRLARLQSPKDPRRGAIPTLAHRIRDEGDSVAADSIQRAFGESVPEVLMRLEEHFGEIEEELCRLPPQSGEGPAKSRMERASSLTPAQAASPDKNVAAEREAWGHSTAEAEGIQVRYKDDPAERPFWTFVSQKLGEIQKELVILFKVNERAISSLKDSRVAEERKDGLLLELTSFGSRLEAVLAQMERFRDFDDSSEVRWVGLREGKSGRERPLDFGAVPVRVSDALKGLVYDPMRTVVLTSATLSVAGKVQFLGERLGFSKLEPGRFEFREYPSPFNFRAQVMTVVPTDFPPPDAFRYEQEIPEAVFRLVEATRGRAFVLFTSYRLLRKTYSLLEGRLISLGLRPMAQGNAGRSELLESFKATPNGVLFGTDSFWEGVDVKGRALECVIITRLPFRVPSEPIQEARLEDLQSRGENAFLGFTVPQAVLKFKQGFGRLIRSKTDRGIVAVLDGRILTKHYGKLFLRSLPETSLVKAPFGKIVEQVKAFFSREGRPSGLEEDEPPVEESFDAPSQRPGPPW
jgi:ATP-dependent DNA helicase DinG